MRDGDRILITGAGSFATEMSKYLMLKEHPHAIMLVSRNEFQQHETRTKLEKWDTRNVMRYVIGDVCDEHLMRTLVKTSDYVIHSAALKRVNDMEYNPRPAIMTNVLGTLNVAQACVEAGPLIKRAIYLDTDKSVHPINLYGFTKGLGAMAWLATNSVSTPYAPLFSVVRYGNVMGSRGSVLPYFVSIKERGETVYPVTHPDATRFWVSFEQACKMVHVAMDGEPDTIYVPKVKAFSVVDLCRALYQRAEIQNIGLRPGEKVHEELIRADEECYEFKDHYKILPFRHFDRKVEGKRYEGTLQSKTAAKLLQGDIRSLIDEFKNECA